MPQDGERCYLAPSSSSPHHHRCRCYRYVEYVAQVILFWHALFRDVYDSLYVPTRALVSSGLMFSWSRLGQHTVLKNHEAMADTFLVVVGGPWSNLVPIAFCHFLSPLWSLVLHFEGFPALTREDAIQQFLPPMYPPHVLGSKTILLYRPLVYNVLSLGCR